MNETDKIRANKRYEGIMKIRIRKYRSELDEVAKKSSIKRDEGYARLLKNIIGDLNEINKCSFELFKEAREIRKKAAKLLEDKVK